MPFSATEAAPCTHPEKQPEFHYFSDLLTD